MIMSKTSIVDACMAGFDHPVVSGVKNAYPAKKRFTPLILGANYEV
jgi:hypothetical protein